MKKTFNLLALFLMFVLSLTVVGCDNINPTEQPTGGEQNPPTEGETQERVINTYVNYTFDELAIGDSLEEAGYFEYYEGGGFVASSKDEDGNVWIQAKDVTTGSQWALAYTNVYNKANVRINLKNFCVEFDTRLPHTELNPLVAADGGACILWSPHAGRYDLAVHHDYFTNGYQGNSINLWHAMNTDGGPFATTQHDPNWGERGSVVTDYAMTEEVSYKITICGKHQGIDADGNEFFTLYVFVDDELVIYQRDVTYWDGGFGLRGFISPYEYANFKVSDFPAVCPDGINHYDEDTAETTYEIKTYEKLATPTNLVVGESKVTWDAVEGASAYNVWLDDTRVGYVKTPEFDFSNTYGTGTLKVVALTSTIDKVQSDAATVQFTHEKTPIATPVLQGNENEITWAAVEGAKEYQIYVDGVLSATQEGTKYFPLMTLPGEYQITVKAISGVFDHVDSLLSEPFTYVLEAKVLAKPVLSINELTISWEAVTNATGYEVYLNGELAETVTELSYTISEAGEYKVEVKAVDSTGEFEASELSSPVYTVAQETLATPKATFANGSMAWAPVNKATKYAVYRNGAFVEYVESTSYAVSALGVYSVKAIGNGAALVDSEISNDVVVIESSQSSMLNNIGSQNVGDIADFGWNIYNANYVIKEKDANGITWMGTNDPSIFHETWFWAKTLNEETLVDWSWTTYVKMQGSSADDAVQLMFGTAAPGGRYSCIIYFLDGGSLQIFKEGTGMVANSWEEAMGATMKLRTETSLVKGEVAKFTINHSADANGKARITVYVNDVCVLDQGGLVLATGDYGLWLNAGVDAWFGNPNVTTLAVPADGAYLGGTPIQPSTPVVTVSEGTMSWEAVDYAYGYNVYLDGSLVAQLDAKTLSYTCDGAGNYTVCAVGNNGSVSNSAVSETIVISNADALNAPVVSYANNTITWTAVENASKYAIYCNGAFVEYVETTSYTVSKLGVYTVVAVGDAIDYADSLASNEVVLIETVQSVMLNNIGSQNVGDIADFGWNAYNANYVIKEKDANGITWMGTNDPSVFHETWFFAKDSSDQYLNNWSWTTYVKMQGSSADDAVQLMFGTAAPGGRYSCIIYFLDGGSLQIFKEGTGMVANSWEEAMGATMKLRTETSLVKGEVAKFTINHSVEANGTGRITVYVNDVCVLDKGGLVLATGDYGLWLNAGVDAWFGNPNVTTLAVPADGAYLGGTPIKPNAPVVTVSEGIMSWEAVDYAYGYNVYLDGSLVAQLDASTLSYTFKHTGSYTVCAVGNNGSVSNGVMSEAVSNN